MRPDQVKACGEAIKAAITSDDPDAGTNAAIDLIVGIATNLAILAHGHPPLFSSSD